MSSIGKGQKVANLLVVQVCLLISIVILWLDENHHVLAASNIFTRDQFSQLESLFRRREGMSNYLNNLRDQLIQVSASKDLAYQLTFASDLTEKDYYSAIGGVSTSDFVDLSNMFTQQYNELTNQTNTLNLKKNIVENAITLLDAQIIQLSCNGSSINHFASSEHGTVVLKSNNSLVYVGKYDSTVNNQGMTATDTSTRTLKTPVFVDMSPIPYKTIIDVQATGMYNFVILTLDGQVWGWGQNADNALGTGISGTQAKMVKVDFSGINPSVEVKKVKCAYSYNGCFMVASDGRLLYMGEFFLNPTTEKLTRPKVIPTLIDGSNHGVVDVAFGGVLTNSPKSFCLISANNSKVYCAGDNTYGQLGDGTTISRLNGQSSSSISWAPIISDQKFIKVVGALNYFIGVSTEGKLYTWGVGDYRMARPFGSPYPLSSFPGIVTAFPYFVKSICAAPAKSQVMFTDFNDNVYVMGTYDGNDIGAPYRPIQLDGKKYSEISCGDYVMFAQPTSSNYVYVWGKNSNYQIGLDTANAKTAFFEAITLPTLK